MQDGLHCSDWQFAKPAKLHSFSTIEVDVLLFSEVKKFCVELQDHDSSAAAKHSEVVSDTLPAITGSIQNTWSQDSASPGS